MRKFVYVLFILLAVALVTGCERGTPPPDEDIVDRATVEEIEVQILESFPVQVQVVARGYLADGCTEIDEIIQEKQDNTFSVTITTIRPADAQCTQAIVPFEEVIPLDVLGLQAGTYTVTVNGVSGTFELAEDNVLPTGPATSSIGGMVWHDICAVGGEGGEPAEPSVGCVELEGGGYQANGVLDEGEPGIEGVEVSLYAGECPPSEFLGTAITGEAGLYIFTQLEAGTYCVAIDALASPNEGILIPGTWTAPEMEGTAAQTVTVEEGEEQRGVHFGWDYQFLPAPGEG